jgi:hypothetical protein
MKERSEVERYIRAAEAHGKGMDTFDHRAANRAYDRLISALKALRRTPDKGKGALTGLLNHSNIRVRHCAAVSLLPLDSVKALKVLEEIAKDPGMVGLDAETALREWRAGRLNVE